VHEHAKQGFFGLFPTSRARGEQTKIIRSGDLHGKSGDQENEVVVGKWGRLREMGMAVGKWGWP
jgi:hypothetical protein